VVAAAQVRVPADAGTQKLPFVAEYAVYVLVPSVTAICTFGAGVVPSA
jgi:hypothetical protein